MLTKKTNHRAIALFQDLLLHLPLLWMFSGLFLIDGGQSVMTRLIIISVITAIYIGRKSAFSFKQKDKKNLFFILFIGLYILYLLVTKLIHGVDDGFTRTLFVLCLYFYFYPLNRYHINWLKGSIVLGSVLLLCFAYWQAFILNIPRIGYPMNSIPFATYCMLLSICTALIAQKCKNRKEFFFFTLLCFISLICVFLTASRGVLIAIIPCLLIIYLRKKINGKIALSISLALVFIALATQQQLTSIWKRSLHEIKSSSQGNLNNSIGLRLQFWDSAFETIGSNPILGVGYKHYRDEFSRQYKQGLISKEVLDYNTMHYHNQFIDTTVKSGFIGLIMMLSILIYCLYLAFIAKQSGRLPMFVIITSFCIASLTDVPFAHLPIVYLFFILLFLGNNNLLTPTQTKQRNNK